jgi:hypothetical protein
MFSQCKFYAERANGHATSARTGVVLIVSQRAADMNGQTFRAVATPKGDPKAVPFASWVHPSHLAKRCDEITETEARAINPSIFAHVAKFERSPEYRTGHAIEIASAIKRGAVKMQPADGRIIGNMRTTRPEETDGPTGWTHK